MDKHRINALLRNRIRAFQLRGRCKYCFAALTWTICVVAGFWVLLDHDSDTGSENSYIRGVSAIVVRHHVEPIERERLKPFLPAEGTLRVIMALHPKCPCTRTTLAELERLLAAETNPAQCTFLVSLPSGQPISWIDSDTTSFARKLSEAEIMVDIDSKLADQLGLKHSGAMLILRADGNVSFAGGITSGRTCSIVNPGSEAVASLFRGELIEAISTPTFGCPLK